MGHWLRAVGLLGDPCSVASTHVVSKPSVGLVSSLQNPLISAGTRHAHVCTYIHARFFFKPKDYILKKSIQTLGVKHLSILRE